MPNCSSTVPVCALLHCEAACVQRTIVDVIAMRADSIAGLVGADRIALGRERRQQQRVRSSSHTPLCRNSLPCDACLPTAQLHRRVALQSALRARESLSTSTPSAAWADARQRHHGNSADELDSTSGRQHAHRAKTRRRPRKTVAPPTTPPRQRRAAAGRHRTQQHRVARAMHDKTACQPPRQRSDAQRRRWRLVTLRPAERNIQSRAAEFRRHQCRPRTIRQTAIDSAARSQSDRQ
jgi:hypothetical protein